MPLNVFCSLNSGVPEHIGTRYVRMERR